MYCLASLKPHKPTRTSIPHLRVCPKGSFNCGMFSSIRTYVGWCRQIITRNQVCRWFICFSSTLGSIWKHPHECWPSRLWKLQSSWQIHHMHTTSLPSQLHCSFAANKICCQAVHVLSNPIVVWNTSKPHPSMALLPLTAHPHTMLIRTYVYNFEWHEFQFIVYFAIDYA